MDWRWGLVVIVGGVGQVRGIEKIKQMVTNCEHRTKTQRWRKDNVKLKEMIFDNVDR